MVVVKMYDSVLTDISELERRRLSIFNLGEKTALLGGSDSVLREAGNPQSLDRCAAST